MPLTGEYEPSKDDRSRKQVEQYEATNGAQGGTNKGKPVIVVTFKAAKPGKIRKKPLMKIKHNGTYAVVASFDGGPKHPLWYRDIVANPIVELQDGAVKRCGHVKFSVVKRTNGGRERTPLIRNSPPTGLA